MMKEEGWAAYQNREGSSQKQVLFFFNQHRKAARRNKQQCFKEAGYMTQTKILSY